MAIIVAADIKSQFTKYCPINSVIVTVSGLDLSVYVKTRGAANIFHVLKKEIIETAIRPGITIWRLTRNSA